MQESDLGMTRRLWSLNALAVELGVDRRTMAAALDRVPHDGIQKGHKGWWLETALSALERHRKPVSQRARDRGPDIILGTLVERVRHWREIRQHEADGLVRLSFETAADMFAGGDRTALMTWLRAGLPYAARGDWDTGRGFVLISHWILDWGLNATVRAELTGDRESARELRLDCFGRAARV
jgi:hypothetical protein